MQEVQVLEATRTAPNSRGRVRSNPITVERIRVAAYVRVSTDDDDQLGSFESQKLYYEEKIGAYVICWREEDGILHYGKVPNLTAECVEPLAEKELAVAQQKKEKLQGEVQRMPGEEWHLPEGCVSGNILEITEEQADYLRKKLWTPVNTGVFFPKQVTASSWEELEKQDAVLYYSDGTTVRRKVDWEKADIDFKKRGRQTVKGAIRQEHFVFPVAINRADPCVARWNGKLSLIHI